MIQKWNQVEPGKLFDRATINIRNLRLRTFIGFNEEERITTAIVVATTKVTRQTIQRLQRRNSRVLLRRSRDKPLT